MKVSPLRIKKFVSQKHREIKVTTSNIQNIYKKKHNKHIN